MATQTTRTNFISTTQQTLDQMMKVRDQMDACLQRYDPARGKLALEITDADFVGELQGHTTADLAELMTALGAIGVVFEQYRDTLEAWRI